MFEFFIAFDFFLLPARGIGRRDLGIGDKRHFDFPGLSEFPITKRLVIPGRVAEGREGKGTQVVGHREPEKEALRFSSSLVLCRCLGPLPSPLRGSPGMTI
jgi:hypothetical protein